MLGRGSIVLITATYCCTVVGSHHITQVCKNGHYQCSDVNFWRQASPLKAVLNMTLYRYTWTGSSLKQNLELGQTCPSVTQVLAGFTVNQLVRPSSPVVLDSTQTRRLA